MDSTSAADAVLPGGPRDDRPGPGDGDGAPGVVDRARHLTAAAKPLLRGWLHAAILPLALAAGVVLLAVAPAHRGALAVYVATTVLLFGTSALYHRGTWGPGPHGVLKRLDHANIFLIIAGSYTPFAVTLLPPGTARALLWVVWGGAVLGVLFRVFWVGAPRWLYTPVYIALGWVAVFFLGDFLRTGGVAVLVLIATGGVLYSVGGVVYALRRPDPSPRWFGFHEIFHSLTIGGWVTQHVAVWLAVLGTAGLTRAA